MASTSIKAAWISGGAAIAAAIVLGLFGLLSRGTSHGSLESISGAHTDERTALTARVTRGGAPRTGARPQDAYDKVTRIGIGQSFTDLQTGLIVGVGEIETPWLGGPPTAWLKYGLPEDVRPLEFVAFSPADRRRFDYRGRQYDFIVESIDAAHKQVAIRVREY